MPLVLFKIKINNKYNCEIAKTITYNFIIKSSLNFYNHILIYN